MPSDIFYSDIPFHFIPVFQMLIMLTHYIAFTTYQSVPKVSVLKSPLGICEHAHAWAHL